MSGIAVHPALRRSMPLLLTLACAVLVSPLWANQSVSSRTYALRITHQVLSQVALERRSHGLEVKLTVRNGGAHALSDVRLFLPDPTARIASGECAPARLNRLAAGTQQELTWTFECSRTAIPHEAMRFLPLRIEAIDQKTQKLVTFMVTSRGAR